MKIVIIGAPGSGKSTLAKLVSQSLGIPHIEADQFFWIAGEEQTVPDFESRIRAELVQSSWIYEGHLGKVFDLVMAHQPIVILMEENDLVHWYRSMLKDLKDFFTTEKKLKSVSRILFHTGRWQEIRARRRWMIEKLKVNKNLSLHQFQNNDWDAMIKTLSELY